MDALLAQLGGAGDIQALLAQLGGGGAQFGGGGGGGGGANFAGGGGGAGAQFGQGGKASGKGGKGKSDSAQDIEKLKEFQPEQKVWVGGLTGSGVTWKSLQDHFKQVGKPIYAAVFDKKGTGCVVYRSALEVQQAVTMLNGSAIGNTAIQVDYFTTKPGRETSGPSSGKAWSKGTASPQKFVGGGAQLGGGGGGAGAGKSSAPTWGKGAAQSWGKGAAQSPASTGNANLQNLVKQFILKDSGAGSNAGLKGQGKSKGGKGGKDIEKLKTIDASLKCWVGGLTKEVTWKQLEEHFKQAGDTTWSAVFPKGTGCVAFKTADEVQTAIALLNGSAIGDCIIEVDVFSQKSK